MRNVLGQELTSEEHHKKIKHEKKVFSPPMTTDNTTMGVKHQFHRNKIFINSLDNST